MIVEFPSLANPNKFVYIYNSNCWYCSSNKTFHNNFLYQQLNSEEFAIGPRKNLDNVNLYGDYLASLAKAMLNNDELCESLYWEFQSRIENKDIDFYAKIAWKEKDRTKPRYFSKDLNRISAVKSKQFDRRFEPITDEMDGTPEFIFKMLSSEYNSLLKQYNIANSILDYVNSRNNEKKYYSYMPYPAEFLKWSEDATIIRAIYQGWNACKLASQVYCVKKQTTTAINNFMNYTIQSKLES